MGRAFKSEVYDSMRLRLYEQSRSHKVTAGLNGFAFFRFPRVARFCDSDGRCRGGCSLRTRWLHKKWSDYISVAQSR